MLKSVLSILAISVVSTVAEASERYAENGQIFLYIENSDGLIMTSKYPIVIFYEAGASSRFETVTDTIYLGRSCDAFSRDWGAGRWSWSNSGFGVKLAGKSLWFPRQDFPGEFGSDCWE